MSRNYLFRVQTSDAEAIRLSIEMIGKGDYKWRIGSDEYRAVREHPGVWALMQNGAAIDEEMLSLKDCIARCFGITRKLVQSTLI